MAAIGFENIAKSFDGPPVVSAFDLGIRDGEFVVLVGPSGCGKTTSLRMLAGLEAPSAGRIMLDGVDITERPAKDRELAMVFQSYALYPHMSVADNIAFSLTLKKLQKAEISERVAAAAERLEIEHLLDRRPRELSGGQRQRVAVARAIVREPKGFLFDEPLSNLDAKLRHSARVEIRKLQEQLGITTVYVTHDQVEAMTMADRIVVMDGGVIRQAGRPIDVYNDPDDLFVAGFLGAPAINSLPGQIAIGPEGKRFLAQGLDVSVRDDVSEGPATLAFRPEALTTTDASEGSIAFKGRVNFVEALGAETLVDMTVAGENRAEPARLTARLDRKAIARPNDHITLNANPADFYLFDCEGMRIRQAF